MMDTARDRGCVQTMFFSIANDNRGGKGKDKKDGLGRFFRNRCTVPVIIHTGVPPRDGGTWAGRRGTGRGTGRRRNHFRQQHPTVGSV